MPSSYVIGKHYEKFIKDMIATGRYTNASEVIRDALRHFEASNSAHLYQPRTVEEFRAAIAHGAASGDCLPAEDVFSDIDAELEEWEADAKKSAA